MEGMDLFQVESQMVFLWFFELLCYMFFVEVFNESPLDVMHLIYVI